jgi:hypothetical protein
MLGAGDVVAGWCPRLAGETAAIEPLDWNGSIGNKIRCIILTARPP